MDEATTQAKPIDWEAAYIRATRSLDEMQDRAEQAESDLRAWHVAANTTDPEVLRETLKALAEDVSVTETDLRACAPIVKAALHGPVDASAIEALMQAAASLPEDTKARMGL